MDALLSGPSSNGRPNEYSTPAPEGAASDARRVDEPWDDGVTTEAVAHAVLRVVGDLPGQMGRLRIARVVSGHAVPTDDPDLQTRLFAYAVEVTWPLKQVVALVDALLGGGLLAQTVGPRPTLVLTRAGHRALDALEATDATS